MKKIVSVSIYLFLLASMVLSGAGQDPAGIALPDDPSAVVISMDSHGYWSDLTRTNPNPILAIQADGTMNIAPSPAWGPLYNKNFRNPKFRICRVS